MKKKYKMIPVSTSTYNLLKRLKQSDSFDDYLKWMIKEIRWVESNE